MWVAEIYFTTAAPFLSVTATITNVIASTHSDVI